MADIFISHASEDEAHAELLAGALEGEGWTVWWDKIIPAGKVFHKFIQQQLDEARCVVVIWTPASVDSDWVFAEADDASARGVMLPVRLDAAVRPPLPFRQVQAVTIEGWQGDARHAAFRQLVEAVKVLAGAPSPPKSKTRRAGKRTPAPPAEPPPAAAPKPSDATRPAGKGTLKSTSKAALLFSPKETVEPSSAGGDAREGPPYVYTEKVVLAVNSALATRRPLLVRGPSGSGKSTLALNVAWHLGWRYYGIGVTSRTAPRDLLWTVAPHSPERGQLRHEVIPGPLWWAFDRLSAMRRGATGTGTRNTVPADDPSPVDSEHAVVLFDEVDNADPDFASNIMPILGSRGFLYEETGMVVRASGNLLVIFTSNDEKELRGSFVNRCVGLTLPPPSVEQLIQIGRAHFGKVNEQLLGQVAEALAQRLRAGQEMWDAPGRSSHVSVRDFLDAVSTCIQLRLNPGDPQWNALMGS